MMSNKIIPFSFNLNIQNCIEITESKRNATELQSQIIHLLLLSDPFTLAAFHCVKRKKKRKTEKDAISFKFILFLLWGVQWTAAGHHCYQQWVNITKDSHYLNIFIFRTAKVSRKLQERL